jgi:hypothetical protein
VPDGCSKRRPDILIDAGTHFIVVEVDELQHATYANRCEVGRMLQIAQDCGLPTVFVRWNPDEWQMNGEVQTASMSSRLEQLYNTVQQAFQIPPTQGYLVDVIWMYYDNMKVGHRHAVAVAGERDSQGNPAISTSIVSK